MTQLLKPELYIATLQRCTLPHEYASPLAYRLQLGSLPIGARDARDQIRQSQISRLSVCEMLEDDSLIITSNTVGFKHFRDALSISLPSLKWTKRYRVEYDQTPYGRPLVHDLMLSVDAGGGYIITRPPGRSLDDLASDLVRRRRQFRVQLQHERQRIYVQHRAHSRMSHLTRTRVLDTAELIASAVRPLR